MGEKKQKDLAKTRINGSAEYKKKIKAHKPPSKERYWTNFSFY